MSAAELDELRALQARAYRREGGLTDAESHRLQELEARRREQPEHATPPSPVPLHPVSVRTERSTGPTDVSPGTDAPDSVSGEAAPAGDQWPIEVVQRAVSPAGGHGAPPRMPAWLRRHARTSAVAAAALVVGVAIGAGATALVADRGAVVVELTAEQKDWQDALIAEGDYDPGSVGAVGEAAGVVAWVATKDDAAQTCLILGDADSRTPSCDTTESAADEGLWASLTLEVSDDLRREVTGHALFTGGGEAAVALSLNEYDPDWSGVTYATERETRFAERLADEGFDAPSIWVAGYDGETPVWTANSRSDGRLCLIYDAGAEELEMVCEDPQVLAERAEGLVLERFDEEGVRTRIQMPVGQGATYLVITRDGGANDAAGG